MQIARRNSSPLDFKSSCSQADPTSPSILEDVSRLPGSCPRLNFQMRVPTVFQNPVATDTELLGCYYLNQKHQVHSLPTNTGCFNCPCCCMLFIDCPQPLAGPLLGKLFKAQMHHLPWVLCVFTLGMELNKAQVIRDGAESGCSKRACKTLLRILRAQESAPTDKVLGGIQPPPPIILQPHFGRLRLCKHLCICFINLALEVVHCLGQLELCGLWCYEE